MVMPTTETHAQMAIEEYTSSSDKSTTSKTPTNETQPTTAEAQSMPTIRRPRSRSGYIPGDVSRRLALLNHSEISLIEIREQQTGPSPPLTAENLRVLDSQTLNAHRESRNRFLNWYYPEAIPGLIWNLSPYHNISESRYGSIARDGSGESSWVEMMNLGDDLGTGLETSDITGRDGDADSESAVAVQKRRECVRLMPTLFEIVVLWFTGLRFWTIGFIFVYLIEAYLDEEEEEDH